jgi:hypothetical protein
MFTLAREYRDRGMAAYSELQQQEFTAEKQGYTATRHQQEVGTGYFDKVLETVTGGKATTAALAESTEAAQFTASDRLAAAQRAMEADHHDLAQITERVRGARDAATLASSIEDLATFLAGHFEREERDQGIFGILAQRGVSDQVDGMLAEHRRILRDVRNLAQSAREGLGAPQVGERAAAIAAELRDHEAREHAMAERALGRIARA